MIIKRVKNILLKPQTEWDVIAREPTTVKGIYLRYIVPLAAIPVIATIISMSFVDAPLPFLGQTMPLQLIIIPVIYIVALIGVYVISLIISALASAFSGVKDNIQALKVAAYAMTPIWVLGVLNIFPAISGLTFLGSLYGIYLLYLGLPKLMKSPKDKAIGYVVAVYLLSMIVISFMLVVGVIIGILITGILARGIYDFNIPF